jgi:hypothetical protein
VSEYERETSKMRSPWPTLGYGALKEESVIKNNLGVSNKNVGNI